MQEGEEMPGIPSFLKKSLLIQQLCINWFETITYAIAITRKKRQMTSQSTLHDWVRANAESNIMDDGR
jgi:hypothetical protein